MRDGDVVPDLVRPHRHHPVAVIGGEDAALVDLHILQRNRTVSISWVGPRPAAGALRGVHVVIGAPGVFVDLVERPHEAPEAGHGRGDDGPQEFGLGPDEGVGEREADVDDFGVAGQAVQGQGGEDDVRQADGEDGHGERLVLGLHLDVGEEDAGHGD